MIDRVNPQLLYQEDVTCLEFEARVVEVQARPDGRKGVILDRSYFYPTGGGQEHDTGRIGDARVVDVFKEEQNARLVHVVEGQVAPGSAHASIDAERRLRHMQHHTAQHLLTQCILRQAGFETVSANINGYTPSTLDIITAGMPISGLDQAERMANDIIYANRAVKTYFVSPKQLESIPLRRPPKVTENIRIVEIDGFDYSPCGGTHVLQTGSIGLLKVLKAEKQNDRQRIHFIAGLQALEMFQQMFTSLTGLANQLSMGWQDLPELVRKQTEQLGSLQKELLALRQNSIKYEARELAGSGEDRPGLKLVHASFDNRPVAELRLLAEELRKLPAIVAYLASYDGQKVSLLVACSEGSGVEARRLLSHQLAAIEGRGGGDARLAQGGGVATPEQYQALLEHLSIDDAT